MPFSERGSRRKRVWEQIRSCLGRCSLTSTEFVLSVYRICFSALPILKVNSISIKHRRWGMPPSLLCSWDDRIKKDCLSTLDRQSFRVYIAMRLSDGELSNVEKITSAILPWASNILFTHLPFRLFSNLFSVTMLALLLRISSKIAQKCRYKMVELILSTLLKRLKIDQLIVSPLLSCFQDAICEPFRQCATFRFRGAPSVLSEASRDSRALSCCRWRFGLHCR